MMTFPHGLPTSAGQFFGCSPDMHDDRARRTPVRTLLEGLPAQALPAAASLAQYRAPIFAQGRTGSCWGHATAQATYTALSASGAALPFVPSPWFGYANARIRELGSPSDPLQDIGSRPALGVQALSLYGVRRMLVDKTPDGRFSDVWGPEDAPEPNVNVKPTFEDEEQGVENLIVGEFGISTLDPAMEEHLKATIAVARQPIVVGSFVDSAFIYWTPDQAPLDAVNLTDTSGGGHAFVIDEYAIVDGRAVYTVTNSWGPGGERKVTGNWLRTAWDLLAWTVRRG